MNNNESFVQIFTYFFGLVSVIFNVFMFCYIGDLLKERCQQIGTICYTIEWYRMPSRKAIDLLMPIIMSRYPATLTAGKMLTMTLITFSDVSNIVSCSKCEVSIKTALSIKTAVCNVCVSYMLHLYYLLYILLLT